jgi:hypothetical protein
MSDVLQSPTHGPCPFPAVGPSLVGGPARATDLDRVAPTRRRWLPLRRRRARGRFGNAASASAALEVHGRHTTAEVARLRTFSRATAQMR